MQLRRVIALAMGAVVVAAGLGVDAVAAHAAPAGPAPTEAVASPYRATDPTGDCQPAKCDLVSINVVNRADGLKLVATYAGTPYLPASAPTLAPPALVWTLRGPGNRVVYVSGIGGSPSVSVCDSGCSFWNAQTPNIVCESLDGGGLAAPVVTSRKVTVVLPWSCLGTPGEVQVKAQVNSNLNGLQLRTDKAPNSGFSPLVALEG